MQALIDNINRHAAMLGQYGCLDKATAARAAARQLAAGEITVAEAVPHADTGTVEGGAVAYWEKQCS